MLTAFELPIEAYGQTWSIRRFSGELVCWQSTKTSTSPGLPQKVVDALQYTDAPYKLTHPIHRELGAGAVDTMQKLQKMHQRLLAIGNQRFLLSRIYASARVPLFQNTSIAMAAIATLPEQQEFRHRLCFQRSLLASKTSKSFASCGVILIGALLPTTTMHAWIIEHGEQPDSYDRSWINYRPLLALCYP